MNKVENFIPINEYGKTNKGFRTSKNGKKNEIFKKINEKGNGNDERINFDINKDANDSLSSNIAFNRINIIPQKKMANNSIINEDDD